jgi:hypothetical protein
MLRVRVKVMVFNATFNNNSVISWRSVLFVEETGVTGENHRSATSHWQTYHIMLCRVHLAWAGFKLTTSVVIGTYCTSNCKSNYHTITTTMTPTCGWYWISIQIISTKSSLVQIYFISSNTQKGFEMHSSLIAEFVTRATLRCHEWSSPASFVGFVLLGL